MKHTIVTLCGSTRFKSEFEQTNKNLTLAGMIVISVGLFGHSGDAITDEQKLMLDEIHKRKIDLADAIYVINKDGYIGSSTQSEIEYAKQHGKKIVYLEEPCVTCLYSCKRGEFCNALNYYPSWEPKQPTDGGEG